jgi:small subunit ribosomal protein S17
MSDNANENVDFDDNLQSRYVVPEFDAGRIIPAGQVKKREIKIGRVVSTKCAKTIVVSGRHDFAHPKYRRRVHRDKKFYAHDEYETAREGDIVSIVACRPLSRLKRWTLLEIVQTARGKTMVDGESAGSFPSSSDLGA